MKKKGLPEQDAEMRIQDIVEHADELFYMHDAAHRFHYVSPQSLRILGYTPEEMMIEWTSLVTDNPINELGYRLTEKALRTGERQRPYRLEVFAKDRRRVVLEINESPLKDDQGRVIGIIGAARDVTARQQAEEALRESEERFRTLFRSVPVGVALTDADGRIVEMNEAAERLLGLTLHEYLSSFLESRDMEYVRTDGSRMPAGELPAIVAMRERRLVENVEMGVRKPTGEVLWLNITAIPLVMNKYAALVAFMDITALRQAEEARRASEEEFRRTVETAQEAQRLESLGVLAGGIAHDFNNLLTSILGYADLARMQIPPGVHGRELLHDIETAARRAAELTNQMLAYSGKGQFVIGPLDLNRLVEEMGRLLRTVISKGAVIRFNLAPNLPTVKADASQLRQVVMNLITNASDALGDREGVIMVTSGVQDLDRAYLADTLLDDNLPDGPYVFLEVCDTGCGMDGALRSRIFEPFFTSKFTGRGLGLAAVRGIVRAHRGTIRVYSEPGKGSTFKVLLPASGAAASVKPRDPEPGEVPSSRATILVVDDERSVREVAEKILGHFGYRVLTAAGGREALDILDQHGSEVSLVLLDMTMPRMSGEETFRELKRLRPELLVILTSGYNEGDATLRFAGKGLAGFVQKPYRAEELVNRIRKALSAKPAGG